jgi:SRSO17 transposase
VCRRGQPKKPRPAPRHTAQALTADQPEEAWQTIAWRHGSRGILRKQFVELRVRAGTGCARYNATHGRSWTGPEGWLLGERPLPGEDDEPRWFFSSLPADTPVSRLVELAHLRWPIEQFYEGAKGECGLDHFQGRTCEGVHRHVALVMLASTLLMPQSLEHKPTSARALGTAFPPVRQLSLPVCHRQVLVLLFQDLVLWLIETKQVIASCPRRN